MKRYLLILIILVSAPSVFGQLNTVSGIVYDSLTKEPVVYASVGVIGSFQGTATNNDGAFKLVYSCSDGCKIKISSLGYFSKVVDITAIADTLWLQPSTKVLSEVVVRSKDVSAYTLVKRAIKSIDENYITDPFTIKAFYRHYCKDSITYTRLLEAAIDLYLRRGYKKSIYKNEEFKGRLRLNQMRRLYNKYDNGLHPPIAARSTFIQDVAGSEGLVYPLAWENSFSSEGLLIWSLDLLKEDFVFDLNKIVFIDDEKVYEIGFEKYLHKDNEGNEHYFRGVIYITAADYAIVKHVTYGLEYNSSFFNGYTIVEYKKYGSKYAWFRIEREYSLGDTHKDHVEMLNTKLSIGKSRLKYSSNISREMLADISYDPGFWSSFNVIKRNKLEQRIFDDLSNNSGLDLRESFIEEQTRARVSLAEEKYGKSLYDSLMNTNEGLSIFIFWRNQSNGRYPSRFLELIDKLEDYSELGFKFIFISLDHNRELWRKGIGKFNLTKYSNLRIGYDKDDDKYNFKSTSPLPVIRIYKNTQIIEQVNILTWERLTEIAAKYKAQKEKEL